MSGHDFETVGQQWDIPRLESWYRVVGRIPPLPRIIALYLGYKIEEPTSSTPETPEESAARLLGQLGMFGSDGVLKHG